MQSCHLQTLRKGFPEAAGILKWLQKRESKKLSRARRGLHKLDQMELKKELRKATRKSERFLVRAGLSPGARVQKALQNSFQKVENRFHGLDAQDVKTIHRLRVAFKHFRYLAEALKALTAPRLTAMKRYQRRMGELQDMEVIMRTLHTFACRKEKPGSRALGPLRREIRKRRNTALRLFWRQRNELFKFSPARSTASHKQPRTRPPARKLQSNPRPPPGAITI
jgi:CHAD domain-containing protein